MKSMNMSDGVFKHHNIMESAINGTIYLENQIEREVKEGKEYVVATCSRIDKPYEKSGKIYDSFSLKLVIETLIDKIKQNIKEEQFKRGDTILLIDFSDQLSLPENPHESLQQNYVGEFVDNSKLYQKLDSLDWKEHKKYLASVESIKEQEKYYFESKGTLWHVALGDMKTILSESQDNGQKEILEKQGILKEYDFIKGILFYIDGKFYACMRGVEPNLVFKLFTYLSDIKFIENKDFSLD
jgi:hypothetical protein